MDELEAALAAALLARDADAPRALFGLASSTLVEGLALLLELAPLDNDTLATT